MLGATVTLTTHDTAYNLYTLAVAQNSQIPMNCHSINVQWDINNGEANVFIGGPNMTPSANKGIPLNANVSVYTFDTEFNGFQIDGLYLMSDTDGSVLALNVEVI